MADYQNALSGVALKTPDGKRYFIPQKMLEGFSVEDPSGTSVLDQQIAAAPAPLQAHSVSIDRSVVRSSGLFF